MISNFRIESNLWLSLICLLISGICIGQSATIFGIISDLDTGEEVEFATVYIDGSSQSAETNNFGEYSLRVDSGVAIDLKVSRIGYQDASYKVEALSANSKRNINIKLVQEVYDLDITIRDSKIEDVGMVREEVTEFKKLPTASGNFESILPHTVSYTHLTLPTIYPV